VFLDANKDGYQSYYNTILDKHLLAPGGLLVVDNTLMKVVCVCVCVGGVFVRGRGQQGSAGRGHCIIEQCKLAVPDSGCRS
jgi:hypothetical protein